MFPQQRRIYSNLVNEVRNKHVLEAGCGDGVGSALLSLYCSTFVATDVLQENLKFARAVYPWIEFRQWDIKEPWTKGSYEQVVCIETIEHVSDPEKALHNLCSITKDVLWISTPNGNNKSNPLDPPSNHYHVYEFSPGEFLQLVGKQHIVRILDYESMKELDSDTKVNPLVYQIYINS